METILDYIRTEQFLEEFNDYGALPDKPFYGIMKGSQEYERFKHERDNGLISDSDIVSFSLDLFSLIKPREQFYGSVIFSFIAVCLEDEMSTFAITYLHELSDLNVAEISQASRIARRCIDNIERKEDESYSNESS